MSLENDNCNLSNSDKLEWFSVFVQNLRKVEKAV